MREYVIMGYHYNRASGGTRALWLLAGELEKRGCKVNHDVGEGSQNDDAIVLWCEGKISDNNYYQPRKTKRMVGWRLGDFGHFNRDEIPTVFYYVELYKDRPDDRYRLHVPIIDLSVFNSENLPEKKYNCLWVGKGSTDVGNQLLLKLGNIRWITYGWPNSEQEMVELLRGCDILYTVDSNSSVLVEARLCGAIVVYVNPENIGGSAPCNVNQISGMHGGFIGLAKEDSEGEIKKARETLKDYKGAYLESISGWEKTIDDFIKITQEEFR